MLLVKHGYNETKISCISYCTLSRAITILPDKNKGHKSFYKTFMKAEQL